VVTESLIAWVVGGNDYQTWGLLSLGPQISKKKPQDLSRGGGRGTFKEEESRGVFDGGTGQIRGVNRLSVLPIHRYEARTDSVQKHSREDGYRKGQGGKSGSRVWRFVQKGEFGDSEESNITDQGGKSSNTRSLQKWSPLEHVRERPIEITS